MAHPEKPGFASLRIETSFNQHAGQSRFEDEGGGRNATPGGDGIESDRTNISDNFSAHSRDTNEDRSVLSDLHSATPPISVPRPDDRPDADDVGYPHKPDDVPTGSPLDSYFQTRRPSISFNPTVSLDSGPERALEEPLTRGNGTIRTSQKYQPRGSSSLRNALSQDGDDNQKPESWGSSAKRSQDLRNFPTGSAPARSVASPEDESVVASEIDQPTSLTSRSTVSPVTDEVRTPPDDPRDMVLSPFCVPSPTQQFSSPEERSSWSGHPATPFGSKSQLSPTLERSSSLRNSTRHSSRRSTASSGKSPASMFLSMYTGRGGEEPASQPDDEGQMVGADYVLGKQIGFGGFSTVKEAYKVVEHGETKRLAVKIVRKQILGRSERENDEVQAEFDHEVRVWRYLNHAHVLTLDAVYETDFATFCFTKLAIGGTLFDLVRQNRQGLGLKLAKKYSYQLACAIRYLHEDAHVVHRDIKLENCLLDPVEADTDSWNLVLCDFGMAEWVDTDNGDDCPDPYDDAADRPPMKQIGPAGSSTSVAGSLEYASPELLQSAHGVIHPSVDIWAFGVIVFTVIVGSRPFQDPFAPRIQSNILSGKWNHDAVLGAISDVHLRKDREEALALIRGCLEMDPVQRWNIRDVLRCAWLREVDESAEQLSPDSVWKF